MAIGAKRSRDVSRALEEANLVFRERYVRRASPAAPAMMAIMVLATMLAYAYR